MKICNHGSVQVLVDDIGQQHSFLLNDIEYVEPGNEDGKDVLHIHRKSEPGTVFTCALDDASKDLIKQLVADGKLATEPA